MGIPSSGLHSNGYSLVRKVFPKKDWKKWSADLLRPTRLYVKDALKLINKLNKGSKQKLKGLVHMTGGGFPDNLPRIFPSHLSPHVHWGSWQVPEIFNEIQRRARATDAEMRRTFNMGVGLVLAISPEALPIIKRMQPDAFLMGSVQKGDGEVVYD